MFLVSIFISFFFLQCGTFVYFFLINRFQQCLCDEKNSICTVNYTMKQGDNYYTAASPDKESISSTAYGGLTYLCHPGVVEMFSSFTCYLLKGSYDRCNQQEHCRITHFQTTDLGKICEDHTCVNVAWSGYNVDFRNFTNNTEFVDGACGNSTSSTINEPTSSSVNETTSSSVTVQVSESTPSSPEPMHSSVCEGEHSLLIIAAVGWTLFAVTIIIVLCVYVCRRWSFEEKLKETPIWKKIAVIQTAHNGSQLESQREASRRARPLYPTDAGGYEAPSNARPQEELTYLDLVQEDDVYNVIEEDRNARGPSAISQTDIAMGNSSLKVTPPMKRARQLSKKNGLGYANLTGKDKSLAAYENTNFHSETGVEKVPPDFSYASSKGQDEVTIDDYSRLQAGRSNIGPEVTDSFLATYNTATDEPEHNTARDETEEHEMVYPLEDDDDEENRNSGGYTVLEKEKEDSLFRDSCGLHHSEQGGISKTFNLNKRVRRI